MRSTGNVYPIRIPPYEPRCCYDRPLYLPYTLHHVGFLTCVNNKNKKESRSTSEKVPLLFGLPFLPAGNEEIQSGDPLTWRMETTY